MGWVAEIAAGCRGDPWGTTTDAGGENIMTSKTRHWAGRVSLCTAAIISAPAALAQQADDYSGPIRLEEVVVTATKRSEALKDVPVAVTAITSEEIEARGFTNYSDYINTVPNMYVQNLGPGQTQIY